MKFSEIFEPVQFRCSFGREKAEVVENQRLPLEKGVQDETRTHTPERALPPQSSASTNSATWTTGLIERQTGLGPATSTLARSRSTN